MRSEPDRGTSAGDGGNAALTDELVFYTKHDCPLCEQALAVARELADRHGLGLRTTSIETEAVLRERYGERVPVLEFRGEVVGWGRLSARALERDLSRRLDGAGEAGVETLEQARLRYFREAGLPLDGGYEDRWVKLNFLGIPVAIPNTPARIRAVRYHDLHHVLTRYGTDWPGEGQISAWEIASGCRGLIAAWILNLYAMGIGLAVAPARTHRAFLRGRRSSNLYGLAYDRGLLVRTVVEVRKASGLTGPVAPVGPGDQLAFGCWALAAGCIAALPFVATGLGIAGVVAWLFGAG